MAPLRWIQRRIVRRMAAELELDEIGFEAVERALAVGAETARHAPSLAAA